MNTQRDRGLGYWPPAKINTNRETGDPGRKLRLEDQVQRLKTFNTLLVDTLCDAKQFMVYGTRGSHAERDLLKKINKVLS